MIGDIMIRTVTISGDNLSHIKEFFAEADLKK